MGVRKISSKEILDFCKIGNQEEDALKLQERVIKAFEEKRSKIEWFYILEKEGRQIGRVAFDTFPSESGSLMPWLLYIAEEEDYIRNGVELLNEAIKDLKGKGINLIVQHLYGNGDQKFNAKRDLLLNCGFEIEQRKKSFIFSEGRLPTSNNQLNFKSIKELDDEMYIDAIMKVTEGTLDSYDEMEVKKMGARVAAENSFNTLKDIDFHADWWKLAYEEDGSFVGLILSQKFNDEYGAINYIGVCPEKRGKGYVNELLIEGTSVLKKSGIKKVIADIDINNYPMENALITAGYEFSEMELVLEYNF